MDTKRPLGIKMKKFALAAVATVLATSAVPASAATIIGLYNTGVDTAGNKITIVDQPDIHYLVSNNTSFTTNNIAYVQDSNAQYIASQKQGQGGSQTYTLNFSLGGASAASAFLSGSVAYDNLVKVFLNGNLLYSDQNVGSGSGTYAAFNQLHAFSTAECPGCFVSGSNALTFNVTDLGQPTALLVTNLSGTAVPESATWAMMLMGFGMIGFGFRRRRKPNLGITYA